MVFGDPSRRTMCILVLCGLMVVLLQKYVVIRHRAYFATHAVPMVWNVPSSDLLRYTKRIEEGSIYVYNIMALVSYTTFFIWLGAHLGRVIFGSLPLPSTWWAMACGNLTNHQWQAFWLGLDLLRHDNRATPYVVWTGCAWTQKSQALRAYIEIVKHFRHENPTWGVAQINAATCERVNGILARVGYKISHTPGSDTPLLHMRDSA